MVSDIVYILLSYFITKHINKIKQKIKNQQRFLAPNDHPKKKINYIDENEGKMKFNKEKNLLINFKNNLEDDDY